MAEKSTESITVSVDAARRKSIPCINFCTAEEAVVRDVLLGLDAKKVIRFADREYERVSYGHPIIVAGEYNMKNDSILAVKANDRDSSFTISWPRPEKNTSAIKLKDRITDLIEQAGGRIESNHFFSR